MLTKPYVRKSSSRFEKYGLLWQPTVLPASMELDMIRHGGQWEKSNGGKAGNGIMFHFKELVRHIWPFIEQHRWFDKFLEEWLAHKYVGVMGPKNSGKTNNAAVFHLADYYAFPDCTTVLVCSTTLERLEDRIWGEMKKLHKLARELHDWIPGQLIEGKHRIVTDNRSQISEGRDFRNGVIGVPCQKGNQYVGMGNFIGIKNKRMRLCGDELQLLPKSFIDSLANLSGNADLKVTGLGNPKETIDSLGFICEPHSSIGGWDGGIDQTPKTKSWPTRFPNGICIQFPGGDSPNNDYPDEPPRFPFLITRKQMQEDAQIWGSSDWHYTMFNEARMPRGQGTRRVLTRQACLKFGAFNEAVWRDSNITSIAFLDAAYRGVGGDRCVFGELQFGYEAKAPDSSEIVSSFISQGMPSSAQKQIVALNDVMIIPINADLTSESPEDQIVAFVKDQCDRRGIPPGNLFYDAGMRTTLVTAFCRLWSTETNSIDFGGKPSEMQVSSEIKQECREYYSKFVTELWYSVRYAVESGQFRGMTEDACQEFCQREWKNVAGNKIEVESKREMREKTGRSPDIADGIAVGLFGARRKGFVIQRLIPDEVVERKGKDWRDEVKELARRTWSSGQLNHAA